MNIVFRWVLGIFAGIIGIIFVFAFIGTLLSVEEPTITSNVIKEGNSVELTEESIEEQTITSNIVNKEVTLEEEIIQEETTPEEIIDIVIPKPTEGSYIVTRVIDGDTIEIETGERVRLICINTPETGEKGYKEAKDFLTDLILNKEVKLVLDITEKDKYGRLLRYIYSKDGRFVNELIVRLGYGVTYPYGQDIALCPRIENAERLAEESKLGIWEIEENYVCSTNVYNCGDFSSCSEVMEVFNACSYDIHYLDGDDDGIPCESLCG